MYVNSKVSVRCNKMCLLSQPEFGSDKHKVQLLFALPYTDFHPNLPRAGKKKQNLHVYAMQLGQHL